LKILDEYSVNNFLTRDIITLRFINVIEKHLIFNKSLGYLKHKALLKRILINNITYIGRVYNNEIEKNEELKTILNKYEFMWVTIKGLVNNYSKDRLEYVRGLRNIIKNMPEGKQIIEDFMEEINSDPISEAMKEEKGNLLLTVEQLCSVNKLIEAREILNQLSEIFIYDGEILNTKGVLCYLLGDNEQALIDLSMACELQEDKFDSLYNLCCVFENMGKIELTKYYLKKAYEKCKNDNLKQEILERL
jgi:tetratricopeptide (TPR) repeat protein